MALVFPNIQLNDVINGEEFAFKAAVVAASNSNVNWTGSVTASYSAPTLTLSNLTSSGGSIGTLDGITTLAVGDRILIKDGATLGTPDLTINGIWEITGGSATSITCIRPFDFQEGSNAINANVWINSGSAWAQTGFVCISATTVQTGVAPAGNLTFNQYDVRNTLAAARGGTGVTSFGGTNTLLYTTSTSTLAALATANNSVVVTDGSGAPSLSTTLPSAVQSNINHSSLQNLLVDSHTQYALLAGRAGGQTLIGGTAAAENLTLQSTANASRGAIIVNDLLRANTIDAATATTFSLGATTATAVQIAQSGVTTQLRGPVAVAAAIDTITGVTMTLGATTATKIELGRSAITTEAKGLLTVAAGSGFGVDTSAAGILKLGQTTANKVDIASAAVTTEVKGALTILSSIDRAAAGTLTLGTTTATAITIAQSGVTTTVGGPVAVQSIIDTSAAAALNLGPTTANKVNLASASVTTEVKGPLTVLSSIDRAAAGVLTVGATTATEVQLGAPSILTHVMGSLLVDGTTTTVNSEQVNVADNYFYMNADYTTVSAMTGGLVVNYLPTATATTVATGGFATTSTVITTGSATFAAGDLIQITGSNNPTNSGIFEVLTHVGTTLTIDTTPTEPFVQNTFVVDTTVAGAIRKVTVAVMRAGTSGDWQVAKGATTPLTYSNLAVSSRTWSFEVVSAQVNATSSGYTTVAYFPWRSASYNPTTVTMITWINVGANRDVDLQVWDGSAQIGIISVASGTAAGIFTASITPPGSDKRLEFRVRKSSPGGTNPQIYGINLDMST